MNSQISSTVPQPVQVQLPTRTLFSRGAANNAATATAAPPVVAPEAAVTHAPDAGAPVPTSTVHHTPAQQVPTTPAGIVQGGRRVEPVTRAGRSEGDDVLYNGVALLLNINEETAVGSFEIDPPGGKTIVQVSVPAGHMSILKASTPSSPHRMGYFTVTIEKGRPMKILKQCQAIFDERLPARPDGQPHSTRADCMSKTPKDALGRAQHLWKFNSKRTVVHLLDGEKAIFRVVSYTPMAQGKFLLQGYFLGCPALKVNVFAEPGSFDPETHNCAEVNRGGVVLTLTKCSIEGAARATADTQGFTYVHVGTENPSDPRSARGGFAGMVVSNQLAPGKQQGDLDRYVVEVVNALYDQTEHFFSPLPFDLGSWVHSFARQRSNFRGANAHNDDTYEPELRSLTPQEVATLMRLLKGNKDEAYNTGCFTVFWQTLAAFMKARGQRRVPEGRRREREDHAAYIELHKSAAELTKESIAKTLVTTVSRAGAVSGTQRRGHLFAVLEENHSKCNDDTATGSDGGCVSYGRFVLVDSPPLPRGGEGSWATPQKVYDAQLDELVRRLPSDWAPFVDNDVLVLFDVRTGDMRTFRYIAAHGSTRSSWPLVTHAVFDEANGGDKSVFKFMSTLVAIQAFAEVSWDEAEAEQFQASPYDPSDCDE